MILYPVIGYSLHIPDAVYGAWAATSVHNTAQAIAVGTMYTPQDETSAQVSAAIKLARNSLLPFLVLALGFVIAADIKKEKRMKIPYLKIIAEYFPLFILGFLALAIWNTISSFSKNQIDFIMTWWKYFTLTGFIGVGLLTDLRVFKTVGGLKPFVVFTAAAVILMLVSIALAYVFFYQ